MIPKIAIILLRENLGILGNVGILKYCAATKITKAAKIVNYFPQAGIGNLSECGRQTLSEQPTHQQRVMMAVYEVMASNTKVKHGYS